MVDNVTFGKLTLQHKIILSRKLRTSSEAPGYTCPNDDVTKMGVNDFCLCVWGAEALLLSCGLRARVTGFSMPVNQTIESRMKTYLAETDQHFTSLLNVQHRKDVLAWFCLYLLSRCSGAREVFPFLYDNLTEGGTIHTMRRLDYCEPSGRYRNTTFRSKRHYHFSFELIPLLLVIT